MKQAIIAILILFLSYNHNSFAEENSEDGLDVSGNKIQVKRKKGEKDIVLFAEIKTGNSIYTENIKMIAQNILQETAKLIQKKQNVLPIVQNKLENFEIPTHIKNFEEIQGRGIDYIVTGVINPSETQNGTMYNYQFFIWDIYEKQNILAEEVFFSEEDLPAFTIKFASRIYEFITGEYSFFSGKLLYTVTEREGVSPFKRVVLSKKENGFIDATIFTNGKHITFNPRSCGNEIMYSIQTKEEGINIIILNRLTRDTQMVKFPKPGKQALFSPNFSSDCKKIVFSKIEATGTSIFLFDRHAKEIMQLTRTKGVINTSAVFSPLNDKIFFVSDRTGRPKIWEMEQNGGNQKQITFSEGQHFAPHVSGEGRYIAFVTINAGKFHLQVLDFKSKKESTIYSAFLIEDPTWTPTGKTIVFSMKKHANDKSRIYTISANGGEPEELEALKGFLNEPRWINEL
jgi:TolB protein